jgi:MATE family multidrug resistance protein
MEVDSKPANSLETKWNMHELLSLLVPIFAILFMASAAGLFERVCLARYSLQSLEGAIQAVYILQILQFPLISFANMAQAFIGKHLGSGEPREAGRCVWQMGWISLFSMGLTVPVGIAAGLFFLKSQSAALGYFITLMSINFLFPLGAALSAFYLALGKTSFILRRNLAAYSLSVILAPVFIFGIPHLLTPLGALGAAISVAVGRLVFCASLFFNFIHSPWSETYGTRQWKIDFSKIKSYSRIGIPRALGRGLTLLVWGMTSHFMAMKGGDYLVVLSIGGTVILFCYFFADSLIQSLTVIFSRCLGTKQYQEISKSWRAGLIAVAVLAGMLSIPLLTFPDFVLSFFFADLPTGPLREYLRLTLYWVWGWVLFSNLAGVSLSFLLAMKDTFYYMAVMFMTLLTSALPVYFFINHLGCDPDKFWMILMLEYFLIFCFYTCRAYWLRRTLKIAPLAV